MKCLDVIIVALIVSLVAPILLAFITNRENRLTKKEQWAREDAVAAKAQQVVQTLKENTTVVNTKLDTIHTLVNSNMTAAMQSELAATRRELVLMKEVLALKGETPSEAALKEIARTEKDIKELVMAIEDRTKAIVITPITVVDPSAAIK